MDTTVVRLGRWSWFRSPILLPLTIVFFLASVVLVAVLINLAAVVYLVSVGGASLWGLIRPLPAGLTRRQSITHARRAVTELFLRRRLSAVVTQSSEFVKQLVGGA